MDKKLIRITTVPGSLGGLLKGQLHFMKDHFDVLGISSYNQGQLTKVGEVEKIRTTQVEMTRKITPFKDLISVWKLYRIFKKEKPFIVHTHTPKAGTLGMFAAYLAKVPHRLHTIAGLPLLVATGPKRALLDTVEKFTYKCATKIYPNSFGLKDIIIENGYTSDKKLKVIGNGSSNGINTSFFDYANFTEDDAVQLRNDLGIKSSDYVFLFLGRLVKDKGINELIAAFTEINNEYANTKLILLGDYERELDPILPENERLIDNHEAIFALGSKSDVRPYFNSADCMVFPSYREGFPNVVMEAGAMGVPSIVTDINGCNEIIEEGVNGTIIPVASTTDLTKAMKRMIADTTNKVYDKKKVRQRILAKYDRPTLWRFLLKEYESLQE